MYKQIGGILLWIFRFGSWPQECLWPNQLKIAKTLLSYPPKKCNQIWLIFSISTKFGAKRQEKKTKKIINLILAFFAIIWQKMTFYSPKTNEIGSKGSKTSYFDIVKLVKHFIQGLGRRSDYGQNRQIIQKSPKNYRHPQIRKYILYFGLYLVYAPILVPNG